MDEVTVNTSTEGTTIDEPQLLAGKYKTEEDLQKGVLEVLKHQNEGKSLEEIYKSLESGIGADTQKQKQQPEDNQPTDNTKEVSTGADQNTTFDFSMFEQELTENQGLTEESYAKLEAQGIPRQMVDGYIEGMKALGDKQAQEFYAIVGGQETYNSMLKWAETNLTESEKQVFNDSIATGSLEQAKFATEALHGRYLKAKGNPPTQLYAGDVSSTSSKAQAYGSVAQLTKDINDPRYHSDPAFRKQVQQKIIASNIL